MSVITELQRCEVYLLRDPDTLDVRYIGVTTNSQRRLTHHLSSVKFDQSAKAEWIRKLKKAGKKPILEVIETVPAMFGHDSERYWIEHHQSAGADLFNRRTGPKPKPDEEKAVTQTYRCPRDLADAVRDHIAKGERSGIIQECLRREVRQRRRCITADQPIWQEFVSRLSGPEGCNFRNGGDFDCSDDFSRSERILTGMGFDAATVKRTVAYLATYAACDCEAVLNSHLAQEGGDQ